MYEKHGYGVKDRLYRIWVAMRQRCSDPRRVNYQTYGGRGIAVCAEWDSSFLAFKTWAEAAGYADDLSIDRVDVNGNYEPGNCRWASPKTQMENRSCACWIEAFGERRTVSEWARVTGMHMTTLYRRYRRGIRGEALFDLSVVRPAARL